jgi:hypothetical protein
MVIKRTTLKKMLLLFLFYMPFLRFFTANFGTLYSLARLSYPIFIIFIVLGLYFGRNEVGIWGNLTNWIKAIIFFQICFAMISFAINVYSLNQFFYGLYYHLRLPLFIILLIVFIEKTDVDKINDFIIKIVYVDAVFMTYQFLFMGLRQDFLGGIFGNTQGCNGIQNIVCCIGLSIVVSRYIYKEINLRSLLSYVLVTCYMAAIAELTIYFFEIIVVLLISFAVAKEQRISMRKVIMIFAAGMAVIVGFALLFRYFPTKARFLNIDEILRYLGADDSGVYSVSRIHGISQIKNAYLNDGVLPYFGLGLGRTLEGTPFHTMYGRINYTWFSSTLLMMESGYFGVFIRLFMLFILGTGSYRNLRETNDETKRALHLMSFLMAILSVIWFFYNSTLDDKYCVYMIAFALSVSSITKKEEGKMVK